MISLIWSMLTTYIGIYYMLVADIISAYQRFSAILNLISLRAPYHDDDFLSSLFFSPIMPIPKRYLLIFIYALFLMPLRPII